LLATAAGAVPAAARAQAEGEVVLARKHYEEGLAHEKVGKWQEALASYEKALALKETPQILLRAAVCHENLGRVAKALVVLERAREQAKLKRLDDVAQVVEERLAAIRPRVPYLTVAVPEPPEGLSVQLDGSPLAAATFGSELPVDAGEHTLSAAAPGRAPFEQKIRMAEGARQTVEVRLLPGTGAPPPPPPPDAGGEPLYLPGGLLVGGGAAAVAVGAVLVALAQSKEGDVDERCGGPERLSCPIAEQSDIEGQLDTAGTFRAAGFAVGAVGVAAVVTGVVLLIVPPESGSGTALRVVPAGESVALELRF
jgi:hypothetical protein